MAYDKQTWTAREGTNLKKYTKSSETATTVILTNTPDSITVEGTPFSVERMNHIEDGIEAAQNNTAALKISDPIYYESALSQTSRNWRGMTILGNDVYACVREGDIYKQTSGTGNFIALSQTSREWIGMATLGTDVYACVYGGDIYKQTGGTGDFIALGQTSRNWSGMTTLGNDVYACTTNSGDIYKQTSGTGNFIGLNQTPRNWTAMATLGTDVYACVYGGDIYKQTGGTGDFIALGQTSRNWQGLCTIDNSIYACVYGGDIYEQLNGAGDFIALGQTSRNWGGITALGNILYSGIILGDIYTHRIAKALEVYSTAETLTNQTYLGYPVYRKVINFGALPNATTKTVAHGVTGDFTVRNIYLSVKSSTVQSNFSGLAPADSISRIGDNVFFSTSANRSTYTGYVIMEYVKTILP